MIWDSRKRAALWDGPYEATCEPGIPTTINKETRI